MCTTAVARPSRRSPALPMHPSRAEWSLTAHPEAVRDSSRESSKDVQVVRAAATTNDADTLHLA